MIGPVNNLKEKLRDDNLKKSEESVLPKLGQAGEHLSGGESEVKDGNININKPTNVTTPTPANSLIQVQEKSDKEDELREMHYENVQKLASSLFSHSELLQLQKKGKIGALEAARRFGPEKLASLIPFVGSFSDVSSSSKILDIARRFNKGGAVTKEEKEQLEDYLKLLVELEVRGGYTTGASISQGIPEVIGFMAEIAASSLLTGTTAGAAAPAAAASVAKRATASVAKNILKKQLTKNLVKNIGTIGKGVKYVGKSAETTALLSARTFDNYNNRRMLIEGLTLTDKGAELLSEAEEKPYVTFMKAYGDIFAEVLSEGTGVLISKGINYSSTAVGKRIAEAIPDKFTKKIKELYTKLHPENKWSDFVTDRLMYNGFIEELGENRIAELLKVSFGASMEEGSTLEQIQHALFPDTEEFLVEAGIVSALGTTSNAGRIVYEKLSKLGNTEEYIANKFQTAPMKQLESEANGEIKNITPNYQDKSNKTPQAVESRKGFDLAAKLYENYNVEGARKQIEGLKSKNVLTRSWAEFKRGFFDKFYFLRLLSPKVNSGISARNGVAGRAEVDFKYSGPTYLSQDGKVVHTGVESYESIMKSMHAEMGTGKNVNEEFQQVGQTERNLYLAYNRFGKKIQKTAENQKAALIEKIGEEKYEKYKKHAKRISAYVHAINYGDYKEGLIDKTTYIRRNKENEFYWPMQREVDQENDMIAPPKQGGVAIKAVSRADANLKEAGFNTEFKVEDLSYNVAALTLRSKMLRANHQINRALYEVAQSGEFGEFIRVFQEGDQDVTESEGLLETGKKDKLTGFQKANIHEFYLDGEKKRIVVSRELVPALVDMEQTGFGFVVKLLRSVGDLLRKGATTYNLAYSIMNPLKDQFVAYYQTDVGYVPFFDFIGGLRSYIKKDDDFVSFMASGASNSGFTQASSVEDAKKYAKKIAGKSSFFNHINVFNWLEELSTAMESATRIGVYKKAIGKNKLVRESLAMPSEAELRQRELQAFVKEMGVKAKLRAYEEGKQKNRVIDSEITNLEAQNEFLDTLEGLPENIKKENKSKIEKQIEDLKAQKRQNAEGMPTKKELDDAFKSLEKWHSRDYSKLKAIYNSGWKTSQDTINYLYGKNPTAREDFVTNENQQIVNAFKELELLKERLSSEEKVSFERLISELNNFNPQTRIEKIEAIPLRVEIFKRGLDRGMTVAEAGDKAGLDYLSAAYVSRNATTDFATMGSWIGEWNAIVPFVNAQIQSWKIATQNFKNNWFLTTAKAISTHTAPSLAVLIWNLFGADEETKREFLEMPEWRKNAGINIKLFGVWWFIPRPFEYGYIFGAIPERTIENLFIEDPKKALELCEEFGFGLISSASPMDFSSPLPSALTGVVETIANINFFKRKQIVPGFMQKLDPRYQYREDTSLTARKIGDLLNWSPMKIENFVKTQFAGAGRDALRLGDSLIRMLDEEAGEAPDRGISDIWGLSSVFRGDPIGFRSKSVTEFYELYDRIERVHNSYNSLLKTNREKAYSYKEKNYNELSLNSKARFYRSQLQKLSKRISKIKADPRYSGAEKREYIEDLEEQMTVTASTAVSSIKQRLR